MSRQIITVPIPDVLLDPKNYRENWAKLARSGDYSRANRATLLTSAEMADLDDLMESIRVMGITDTPGVHPHPTLPDKYLVHNGNRRTTACYSLMTEGFAVRGMSVGEMPVIVEEDYDEGDLVLAGLVANEQRSDLNDMERCAAYCETLLVGVPFDSANGQVRVRLTPAELEQVVMVSDLDAVSAREELKGRIAFRHPDLASIRIYEVVQRLAQVGAGKNIRFVLKRIGFRRLCAKAQELVRSGQLTVAYAEWLLPLDHNRQIAVLLRHQQYDLRKSEFETLCTQLLKEQAQEGQLTLNDLLGNWDQQLAEAERTKEQKRNMVTGLRRHPAVPRELLSNRGASKNTGEAGMKLIEEARRLGVPDEVILSWETLVDILKRSYWTE